MRIPAILALTGLLATSAFAAPIDLAIDPDRTLPRFTIDRFGFSSLHGYFVRSSGRMVVDQAAKTAQVDLAVRTTSMRLGKVDADKPVQDRTDGDADSVPSFLEAAAHPEMKLRARALQLDPSAPAAAAELTFRGVTRPVALQVVNWRCEPATTGGAACAGVATAQVRRSEFGMTMGYPFVGDDVSLQFEIAARRP